MSDDLALQRVIRAVKAKAWPGMGEFAAREIARAALQAARAGAACDTDSGVEVAARVLEDHDLLEEADKLRERAAGPPYKT